MRACPGFSARVIHVSDAIVLVFPAPVWVFHSSADPIVPVTEPRQMAEALKSIGGNVKNTKYEGGEHNSWDRAYAEPEFISWLLSQRRDQAKPESPQSRR